MVKLRGLAPSEADVILTARDDTKKHRTNSLVSLLPGSGSNDEEQVFIRTRVADLRNERLPPNKHGAVSEQSIDTPLPHSLGAAHESSEFMEDNKISPQIAVTHDEKNNNRDNRK